MNVWRAIRMLFLMIPASLFFSLAWIGISAETLPAARLAARTPIQQPPPAQTDLAAGHFLVAKEHLRDPNFSKSVVFLLSYGRRGAMGVVINRPSQVKLAEVFADKPGLKNRDDVVFFGGPVQRTQMVMLVRSDTDMDNAKHVFDDVHAGTDPDLLEQLADGGKQIQHFRVYAGHAGWFPDQLDTEVGRGDWLVVEANSSLIFNTPSQDIWPTLMQRGSTEWTQAPHTPDHSG